MKGHGKTSLSTGVSRPSRAGCNRGRRYRRWFASALFVLSAAFLASGGLAAKEVSPEKQVLRVAYRQTEQLSPTPSPVEVPAREPVPVRVVAQPEKGFPWEVFASGLLGLFSAIAAFLIQEAVQRHRKAAEERATVVEMLRGLCSELSLNEEVLREVAGNLREGKLPSKKVSSLTYVAFYPELVRLLKKPMLLHELQSVYHQFDYVGGILEKISHESSVKLPMLQSISSIAGTQIDSLTRLRADIEAHIVGLGG